MVDVTTEHETRHEGLDGPSPRSPGWRVALVVAAAVLAVIGGGVLVGEVLPEASPTQPPSVAPSEIARESVAPSTCESAAPPLGGQDAVFVHFPCGDPAESRWATGARGAGVARQPLERLEVALRALLDGPTELERSLGMVGVVPDGSGTLLAGVRLEADGLAAVDFDTALLAVNNLSTSAAGGAFLTAVQETAFEFGEVTAVELSAGGSCVALFEFFQVGPICEHLAKPLEPVSGCPVVPPAELPSGAAITAARSYPGEPMVSWGSGADTVTQLPGHRGGGPDLPDGGTPVEVRGYAGVVVPVGDLPDSEVQIGWIEDGCAYIVWVRRGDGIEAAIDYAQRYGAAVSMPPVTEPVTASVEDQGIRLTATLDRDTTVFGQRVTAMTTVENIGAETVFWAHSGTCAFPTSLAAHPEIAPSLDPGRGDWPGDAGILKSVVVWVRPEVLELGYAFQPEGWLDFDGAMGCTTDYHVSELRSGERLTSVAEWDTEAWYGIPPAPGAYAIEVTFAFESRGQPPSGDQEPNPLSVTVDVPLTVVGPDVEYISPGIAFDALLADPDYQAQLASITRYDWSRSDLRFDAGRWVAAVYLGRDSSWSDPVPTIVGTVDARTGEVLGVTVAERVRPAGG